MKIYVHMIGSRLIVYDTSGIKWKAYYISNFGDGKFIEIDEQELTVYNWTPV